MILRFELKITETHLLWAVYTYTKEMEHVPENPEELIQWLQRVILREGTVEFRKRIEKWKAAIPDDDTYTCAELIVYEWWGDEENDEQTQNSP